MNSRHALPPPAQARVTAGYAQALLDTAAELGWRPAAALPDPLPVSRYIALLDQVAEATGCVDFGLRVGAGMRTSHLVVYGAVLLSCPSFLEAMRQTQRFEGLAHDLGRSELVLDGAVAEYRWHCPWPASRHLSESVMASVLAFASWLAQRRLPVLDLAFTHPTPEAAHVERLQAFFAAPLRFGAEVASARFPAALLAEPIPASDPAMFPLLQAHAAQLLAARERVLGAGGGWVDAVRRLLAERLAQDGARLPDVAAQLGLSARTLQRRLGEAGLSFQQLLERTRRELAAQYLAQDAFSLAEVAFLLGYTEQSSFTHAHRAWHGCTPQQARQRLLDGPAQV